MAIQLSARVNVPRPVDAGEIRAEMGRHRRSQASIARELGLTTQTLGNKLSGETPFSLDELTHVAALLDVDVSRFLSDDAA